MICTIDTTIYNLFNQTYTKTKKEERFLKFGKKNAPPGNRTRVARMGILHDTITPAALDVRIEETIFSVLIFYMIKVISIPN